ncbi:hypothetical protein Lesp01_85460 [Lentzea sp. NBRC 102530]|nr:hypothetical protein Lesp01_85460 [Lentzea sp. NBRC 102530]
MVRVVATLDVVVDAQAWTEETGCMLAGPDVVTQVTSVMDNIQSALHRMRGTTAVTVAVRQDETAEAQVDPMVLTLRARRHATSLTRSRSAGIEQ